MGFLFKKTAYTGLLYCFSFCILAGLNTSAQENCLNGIDDDGDGLIDLNDSLDCSCGNIISDVVGNVIPNPSFEEMDCCPNLVSQVDCATGWAQATLATSDYHNTCGFNVWTTTPFPDGEGIMGAIITANAIDPEESPYGNTHYYEYIGTCLEVPLEEGQDYTLEFKTSVNIIEGDGTQVSDLTVPIDLTIFGFNNCVSFPIPTLECPEPYGWYPMGSVSYLPDQSWSQEAIDFTVPEGTESIMFGAPCVVDDSYNVFDGLIYFGIDDLVLIHHQLIETIVSTGGNCIDDLVLSAIESDSLTYQWYYEGVAIEGETAPSINLGLSGYQVGTYQVLLTHIENGSCQVVETEVTNTQNSNLEFEADILNGCAPLDVLLSNLTPPEFEGDFTWEINSETFDGSDLNITLSESGLYSVSLTGTTEDGCEISTTIEDYIEVYHIPRPIISHEQLNGCPPYSVLFQESVLDDEVEYFWEFESEIPSSEAFPIIDFSSEGTQIVVLEVQNVFTGCVGTDTLVFEIVEDIPALDITGPVAICDSGVVDTLRALFLEGIIEWDQGSNNPYLEISQPGTYVAELIRSDGCIVKDSILVDRKELPDLSASDREACLGDEVQVFAESNVSDVRWPGLSENYVARTSVPGIYTAEAENECGVTSLDVDVSFKDCSCPVYVPNAFTPNGDGINDIFKPELNCPLQYFELRIFNRWGQEVFQSMDPETGWNGSSNQDGDYFGGNQIYNYILWYDNGLRPINEREKIRGSIQLLR